MHILGYRARYGGRFGDVPVIQAGAYRLVQIKDYPSAPVGLTILLVQAREAGADFLVIDPTVETAKKAEWVNIPQAA